MIERTALRLATVMALANGFAAPWPTMAQGRVFDSRFDPLQAVDLKEPDELLPTILVATDDDRGKSLSENNGGPPFEHEVTLALELSIGMVGESEESELFLGMPQSEPELEAMLDLFERQVKAALVNPVAPWTERFQRVARRITGWSSERFVERDSNVRLAARKISATVLLPLEDLVPLSSDPPAAVIPEPLGSLLAAIAASSSPYAPAAGQLAALLLAAGAGATVTIPKLERVRFIEANQAERNGAGTPKGPRPDGVAEVVLPVP
jgi:hypothetical protein